MLIKETILKQKLGKRIKDIRLSKNITQLSLAVSLDVEHTTISRIESGRTNPTYITLYKIAKALNVELCFLVDMKE